MTVVLKEKAKRSAYKPSLTNRKCEVAQTRRWIWDRPITFDEFLDLYMGRDDLVELVDGVVVEKAMDQLDHDKLEAWLYTVIHLYAEEKDLGMAFRSRIATRVDNYRGRLPDIQFVSKSHLAFVKQKGVFGPPDLVIEIRSPSDRKADLVALEADYRNLGVPEIVFIDVKSRVVRYVHMQGAEYVESRVSDGKVEFECIPGLVLDVVWLFDEPRPREMKLVQGLLGA